MDPKDKKIAELEAALATKDAEIAKKDQLIELKNQDLVGQRHKYKALADMTEEEKGKLSAKELELQERQEALEADRARMEAENAAFRQREIDARRDGFIRRVAGNDAALAEKIKANYGRIVGADKAQTEEEIARFVAEANALTSTPAPDPLRSVIAAGGGSGDPAPASFADTADGKALASRMNIGLDAKKPEGGAPDPSSLEAKISA